MNKPKLHQTFGLYWAISPPRTVFWVNGGSANHRNCRVDHLIGISRTYDRDKMAYYYSLYLGRLKIMWIPKTSPSKKQLRKKWLQK